MMGWKELGFKSLYNNWMIPTIVFSIVQVAKWMDDEVLWNSNLHPHPKAFLMKLFHNFLFDLLCDSIEVKI
jgi:hypothetical protein